MAAVSGGTWEVWQVEPECKVKKRAEQDGMCGGLSPASKGDHRGPDPALLRRMQEPDPAPREHKTH